MDEERIEQAMRALSEKCRRLEDASDRQVATIGALAGMLIRLLSEMAVRMPEGDATVAAALDSALDTMTDVAEHVELGDASTRALYAARTIEQIRGHVEELKRRGQG